MSRTEKEKPVIGILALQGDYDAHRKMLEEQVGVSTTAVRTPQQLEQVDGLILPGGESTTISKLMHRNGLDEAIRARAHAGMPIYGTCAGLILLAKEIEDRPDQPTLGLMDVTVARNAFGRQVDSFEADIPLALDGTRAEPVRGVFIRAPYVTRVGEGVQRLGSFEDKIVGVREGALLGTAFHPELTEDTRLHTYFTRMVAESREER
ncbi:MAG TPA: pyridoxal 5'-phosphate synthase glutaminase subunit PdxT [Chthonomonadaceae bacterium]|nr:pyridoxal 5'-phosphate synthase glutaminase subunit PdxT [Chthonomonadaceae bacterium]